MLAPAAVAPRPRLSTYGLQLPLAWHMWWHLPLPTCLQHHCLHLPGSPEQSYHNFGSQSFIWNFKFYYSFFFWGFLVKKKPFRIFSLMVMWSVLQLYSPFFYFIFTTTLYGRLGWERLIGPRSPDELPWQSGDLNPNLLDHWHSTF